ncbi:MAG: zinc-ribbon domain, partial [Proteobacteria bacterium]|nr:zinc-ribbon domain [Pseudomonadota bacterium]
MKFCPQCGSSMEAGDRFCQNCGFKLNQPAAAAPPSPPDDDPDKTRIIPPRKPAESGSDVRSSGAGVAPPPRP